MNKPLIAAAAVLAVAGSSLVYAQQGDGGHRWDGPRAERHRPSAEDRAAFTEARIAALKAGLQLTPDQEKNWPAFEQAVRDMVKLRNERMQARQAGDQQSPTPATPFDRLARRADTMARISAALKRIADAGAPLYQSLTDAQKNRFVMLVRLLRPHQHGMGNGDGGGWHRVPGRGSDPRFGQDDRAPGGHRFGRDRSPMHDSTGDDGDRDSKL